MRLALFLLLATCSTHQDDYYYNSNSTETNVTEALTEPQESYRIVDSYYPLMLMLISMPENETESLEKYLNQRTYAELKRMIDEKQKIQENGIASIIEEVERNNSDLATIVKESENLRLIDLVEAYHNASIYSAIRGVWNSQVNPYLPPIDQLAILEYFEERKTAELLRMSFWARVWAAFRAWLLGEQDPRGCNADSPQCMRKVFEKLPLEARIELDRAAEVDDVELIENIVTDELNRLPSSIKAEFENWRQENEPPEALRELLEKHTTEFERQSLERLRQNELLHSLKDFYRATIESRPISEQEEIREFFHRMNDTFARCFNPIRGKYEYFN